MTVGSYLLGTPGVTNELPAIVLLSGLLLNESLSEGLLRLIGYNF